jgi:hypothetical protein
MVGVFDGPCRRCATMIWRADRVPSSFGRLTGRPAMIWAADWRRDDLTGRLAPAMVWAADWRLRWFGRRTARPAMVWAADWRRDDLGGCPPPPHNRRWGPQNARVVSARRFPRPSAMSVATCVATVAGLSVRGATTWFAGITKIKRYGEQCARDAPTEIGV